MSLLPRRPQLRERSPGFLRVLNHLFMQFTCTVLTLSGPMLGFLFPSFSGLLMLSLLLLYLMDLKIPRSLQTVMVTYLLAFPWSGFQALLGAISVYQMVDYICCRHMIYFRSLGAWPEYLPSANCWSSI